MELGRIDRARLIDEVTIQLYCRIGLSKKHHPDDLPDYLQAWEYWKGLCGKRGVELDAHGLEHVR
ncbi:hypothetical protein [Cohnella lubricantis]|uniref:Uncharacterized protein n=1 Tax=Cohnella lubricantis TaxID=2163172 RepID=A0A841T720_9BACL|nr:hypothetical protein [Cohnella lubricantis]MBB6675715.1 hypothetical protein [Cohnella lubricantis]MBP2118859.1 hypothetical protein [Cohnella lubricantis]